MTDPRRAERSTRVARALDARFGRRSFLQGLGAVGVAVGAACGGGSDSSTPARDIQRTESPTPAEEGYRMPAEWEPHSGTWFTWPHDPSHWPGRFAAIPPLFARLIKELETGEDVHVLVHDERTEEVARATMAQVGVRGERVMLHRVPNNFAWLRDSGPIFVRSDSGELLISHWTYDAYGNKNRHDRDARIPAEIADITGVPRVRGPLTLEGGAIDVNGQGTLLTTEGCLLRRNPSLSKQPIEDALMDYLGLTKVLWLEGGVAGDVTDGHIDGVARFVGPSTVLAGVEPNPRRENHEVLAENLRRLHKMTDQDGNPLEIVEVPAPKPFVIEDLEIAPTYCNFYIGNEVILATTYNDPAADGNAVAVLQGLFPTRRIAPIDAREIAWGFGEFHCITQQQPAALASTATLRSAT